MLESVLLGQQKQDEYINQLGSEVDLLTTDNKILEIQIAQQASFSFTRSGRLLTKPESNPRENCNAIVVRSGKQLEGPKGGSIGVESQKKNDNGVAPLLCESEPQEKRDRVRDQRNQNLFPQIHACTPCHFHKDLLKLSLILNLAGFLIC